MAENHLEIHVSPACTNGDEPSGAHKCMKCQTSVHAIDGYSKPVGERYGQSRLCISRSKCTANEASRGQDDVLFSPHGPEERWAKKSSSD
ncbi:hypothetical protein PR048_028030 [Dryococelus australis]|uniref:SCAN domain-containing protein n=1 Tax=Dryococelus australis TaxID=614101 RepID=A0ABQ9GI71_9NEOP|nr:hypothetical protein PR048_028030 [Dryococelus australis]